MPSQEKPLRYFQPQESRHVEQRINQLSASADIDFLQNVSMQAGGFDEMVRVSREQGIGKPIFPVAAYQKDNDPNIRNEPLGMAYPMDDEWSRQYLIFRNGMKMLVKRVEHSTGDKKNLPSDDWKNADEAAAAFDRKQRSYGTAVELTNYKTTKKADLEKLDLLWDTALEKSLEVRDHAFSSRVELFVHEYEDLTTIYKKSSIPHQLEK